MQRTLNVSEIFRSIQGEGSRAGTPCVMIRLSGCNLNCKWCDTAYAREGGQTMTLEEILRAVAAYSCRLVELTGGEPLIQENSAELLKKLCDVGYRTLLETNGAVDVGQVDPRVVKIMDVKCPSSGHSNDMLWDNIRYLGPDDEVKFVLADREDYDYARRVVEKYSLASKMTVIFSPVYGLMSYQDIAKWILEDGVDVRMGLQLHKIIWPEATRGV